MSATNGNTLAPVAPVAPTVKPLSDAEIERRARVVAREAARKRAEAAKADADLARKATIAKIQAEFGLKGAKIRAKDSAETFSPAEIAAKLEAARAEGGEIKISVTVPATNENDGRRLSFKLAPAPADEK